MQNLRYTTILVLALSPAWYQLHPLKQAKKSLFIMVIPLNTVLIGTPMLGHKTITRYQNPLKEILKKPDPHSVYWIYLQNRTHCCRHSFANLSSLTMTRHIQKFESMLEFSCFSYYYDIPPRQFFIGFFHQTTCFPSFTEKQSLFSMMAIGLKGFFAVVSCMDSCAILTRREG